MYVFSIYFLTSLDIHIIFIGAQFANSMPPTDPAVGGMELPTHRQPFPR